MGGGESMFTIWGEGRGREGAGHDVVSHASLIVVKQTHIMHKDEHLVRLSLWH